MIYPGRRVVEAVKPWQQVYEADPCLTTVPGAEEHGAKCDFGAMLFV